VFYQYFIKSGDVNIKVQKQKGREMPRVEKESRERRKI
jgi:hypothetical protein